MPELDELRAISRGGKAAIAAMEDAERARTGIASLKIRYNRVFGYYIEISKSNLASVPADYIRKQTIAGGERFITPALKEYEDKVLGADERIAARELELFERCGGASRPKRRAMLDTARAVGDARRARGARRHGRRRPTTRSRSSTTATSSRPPTRGIRSSSGTWPARSCRTTCTSTARRGSSSS